MSWWGPLVAQVSKKIMKDPQVKKMVKEAGETMAKAAAAADFQKKINEAKLAGNKMKQQAQAAMPKEMKDFQQTVSSNIPQGMKNAWKSRGSKTTSGSSGAAGTGSSSSSSSSGGGAAAGGTKWWHRLKDQIPKNPDEWNALRDKVIPFLAANFMGVIFVFQFGQQIWASLKALYHEYRKDQAVHAREQAKIEARHQRDQETEQIRAQKEAAAQEAARQKQERVKKLNEQHAGFASMFASKEDLDDGKAEALEAQKYSKNIQYDEADQHQQRGGIDASLLTNRERRRLRRRAQRRMEEIEEQREAKMKDRQAQAQAHAQVQQQQQQPAQNMQLQQLAATIGGMQQQQQPASSMVQQPNQQPQHQNHFTGGFQYRMALEGEKANNSNNWASGDSSMQAGYDPLKRGMFSF